MILELSVDERLHNAFSIGPSVPSACKARPNWVIPAAPGLEIGAGGVEISESRLV